MSGVDAVAAKVLAVYASWTRETPVERMREDWDRLFGSPHAPAGRNEVIGGVPVTSIAGDNASGARTFVYLHGGGFQIGSPHSHADLVARLAAASGATGLVIDYRLAPEHRYPAQIDDVVAVCAALEARGTEMSRVCFVGDSAGGNLALAATIALRERGRPLPAGLVLLSPWVDLEMLGASYETRAKADPIHRRKMLANLARGYLGDADPASPLASPIAADLRGLPPMLIQVGDREVLLSDSETLAERARAAGVNVKLSVWPDMIHVFQQFPDDLAEARQAIEAIGAFVESAFMTAEIGS